MIVGSQFLKNVLIWAFIVHYSGFKAYKCEGIVALFCYLLDLLVFFSVRWY